MAGDRYFVASPQPLRPGLGPLDVEVAVDEVVGRGSAAQSILEAADKALKYLHEAVSDVCSCSIPEVIHE